MSYGCPELLDGSPIGGGIGYAKTYSRADLGVGDYEVDTLAMLTAKLAAATDGHKVYISDGAVIPITSMSGKYGTVQGFDCMLYNPRALLCAGRGREGSVPGKIQVSSGIGENWYTLLAGGPGAKFAGLTLQGTSASTSSNYNWSGIILGNNGELANSEIFNFPDWGVCIWQGMTGWVHHSNIHHCRRQGSGYGVNTGALDIYHTCTALVEGNLFDYHRHVLAGQNGLLDYTFRYNLLGANAAYEGTIECHGPNDGGPNDLDKAGGEYIYCAGRNLQIYNNTSLCTIQNGMDEFITIRGTPHSSGLVSVRNNWLKAPGRSANNIIQFMSRMPEYGYDAPSGGPYVRMEQRANWFGLTMPPSDLRKMAVTVNVARR
jgi:hypothetical protein